MVNFYRELWNQARRLRPSNSWYQTYLTVNRQLGVESVPESDTLGWRKDLWRKIGVARGPVVEQEAVVDAPASGGILDVLDDIAATPARQRFPNDIYGDVGYRPLPSAGVNPAQDVAVVGPEPEWLVEAEEIIPPWALDDPMDPAYPYLQSGPDEFYGALDRINAPPASGTGSLSEYLPEVNAQNAMNALRAAGVAYYLYQAYERKVPKYDTGHEYTDPWISHALAYRPEVAGVLESLAPDMETYGLLRASVAADDALQANTAGWQKRTGVDLRSAPALVDSLINKVAGRRFYHPAEQGVPRGSTITTSSQVSEPDRFWDVDQPYFFDKLDDVSYYFGPLGKVYRAGHAMWRATHGEFARGTGELTEIAATTAGVPDKFGGIIREGTKEGIEWVQGATPVVGVPAVHASAVADAFSSLTKQLHKVADQQRQQGICFFCSYAVYQRF